MSVYKYCSRCGEELSKNVRERYEEDHQGGPVLCKTCIREVLQGIPEALNSIFEAFASAFSGGNDD